MKWVGHMKNKCIKEIKTTSHSKVDLNLWKPWKSLKKNVSNEFLFVFFRPSIFSTSPSFVKSPWHHVSEQKSKNVGWIHCCNILYVALDNKSQNRWQKKARPSWGKVRGQEREEKDEIQTLVPPPFLNKMANACFPVLIFTSFSSIIYLIL